MSFQARCPYCGQKARAPAKALASSVRCPRCQNSYTAAPADDGPAPKALLLSAPLATALAPAAAPPRTASESTAAPAMDLATAPGRPASPRRRVQSWIHPGGLAACLLGSGALLAASFPRLTMLTLPLGGLGLAAGVVAIRRIVGTRPLRRVLPIAGTILSALVLVVALLAPHWLGPVYHASRERLDYSPQAVLAIPLQLGKEGESLETDGWADASRAALQQDRVRIQVVAISAGPVKMTAPKGMSKESYVAVALAIQHLGHGPALTYIHWGAPGMQETPHPTLTQAGRKLDYRAFESEVVAGQVRQGRTLYPGKAVEDVLLFDAALTPGEPLRLELPTAVWGGRGVLRFRIPWAMVRQTQTKGK